MLAATEGPGYPHVYIMACAVNEVALSMVSTLRLGFEGEPEWMIATRRSVFGSLRAVEELAGITAAEQLRRGEFVKVGSTYGVDPSNRTTLLSDANKLKTTMMCLGVPVVGTRVLCYIPGEEELEFALHSLWCRDRIDPKREFFWINSEIDQLCTLYRGYQAHPVAPADPYGPLPDDPFAAPARRRKRGKVAPEW